MTMQKFKSKILSPKSLARLSRGKLRSKKIVFTNGCFDIVHAGHVTYLEKAREKGDYLVVALDTDASVRTLKGKGRPVNLLKDRMAVIAALGFVDFVTWFENSDPRPLIESLRPRVLVKGGDWKPSQIKGAPEVRSWGGKVLSIPLLKGRSTSQTLRKLHSL